MSVPVCAAVGCWWDERGTNGGAPVGRCGYNPPYDSNGAVIADCLVMAGLEIPPPRRRSGRGVAR